MRKLCLATAPNGYRNCKHIRTILRVQSQTVENGVVITEENRYLVSSKDPTAITAQQWLALVRSRWAMENNVHWTADAIFEEDERPWIQAAPRGTVVLMVLRRIAYNLLALFRSVTLKSEESRAMKWRELVGWVYDTLIAVTVAQLEGLRDREVELAFH